MKEYSLIDQWIIKADRVLRTVAGISLEARRAHPAEGISEGDLSPQGKETVASLMYTTT